MNVVFYTENYVVGGCDRFLVDLVRNLDGGAFVTSLAGNPSPAFDGWLARRLPSHLPRHEVNVSTLPNSRLAGLAPRTAEPSERDALPGASSAGRGVVVSLAGAALRYEQAAQNYLRLRRLFRRLRPDVLHINNGGYPGGETCRIAALAAHAEGIQTIVHFVHNMAYPPVFPTFGERLLDQRIDRATHLWLTAADRAATALHEQRGIPRERIETVHYGIESSNLSSRRSRDGGAPVLSVVASFEPRKGHRYLVRALKALKRSGFSMSTLLIGEGPERANIERQASEAGLSDDVRFLGWREDVDELLSASDLLVLPSVANECLPYAILEAMSYGLPVVATDVAGIPELVVDGVTGRVVPPADTGELARAIREIAGDRTLSRAMGQRGRERVDAEFSLERMVRRMSEIYARLVGPPAHRNPVSK